MAIHFVDESENHGWINPDLEVDYDGPANVEQYIEKLFEDEMPFEFIAEELLIDMPHDLPVVEVRREEPPNQHLVPGSGQD